jgi:eukaryotic-like serine/threonine-protein kinase
MPDRAAPIKKLGRYDITRVLGKGAMGVVYEARDPNLNRKVAIKTVRVDSLSAEEGAEYEMRFRTEAHSAARLQHPNIVSVYDSDRDGPTAFLVMEFIKGDDLKHYLDAGHRYTLEQSVHMMRDLLAAMEYAHQRKIIHRDIKPANLLIEADGRVKLTDFGVARIQDSGEITRTQGGMVGTLKYMSPEQVEGKSADAASDLFSAGIVLYQLLTDRRPFDGDSYLSIVNQITKLHPPKPSSINPMLPVEVDAVVARALAKNKAERFATAQDFSVALQAAARRADPTITPMANPYKTIAPDDSASLSNSGSKPGKLNNTGSTITQEVELVYWKDVKESDDADDIEGFLSRFPEGVYADLAKRRLKRIADAQAALGQDLYERTVVATPQSNAADETAPTSGKSAAPAAQAAEPDTMPATLPHNEVNTSKAAVPAPQAAPVAPELPKHTQSMLWLALGSLVAVAVVTGWLWKSHSTSTITETSAQAGLAAVAASAAHASTATAAVNPVAESAPAAPMAAVANPTPVAIASAPKSSTLAPHSAASVKHPNAHEAVTHPPHSSAANHTAASAVEPAAPPPAEPVPTHNPAPHPKDRHAAGPKEACESRNFFTQSVCVYEQCTRPAFHDHPYCVQLRERQEKSRLSN